MSSTSDRNKFRAVLLGIAIKMHRMFLLLLLLLAVVVAMVMVLVVAAARGVAVGALNVRVLLSRHLLRNGNCQHDPSSPSVCSDKNCLLLHSPGLMRMEEILHHPGTPDLRYPGPWGVQCVGGLL